MIRVPVAPENVTVLGNKVKATDASWLGLDLDRAEPRVQASVLMMMLGPRDAPLDIHLNVPWCHPSDRADGKDDDGLHLPRPPAHGARQEVEGQDGEVGRIRAMGWQVVYCH